MHELNDTMKYLEKRLIGKVPLLMLDYDGTISDLVDHPQDAVLVSGARQALDAITKHCRVAIVSGRDLEDLERRINIPGVAIAACHGAVVKCSGEKPVYMHDFEFARQELNEVHKQLSRKIGNLKGVYMERKSLGISVHYRHVSEIDRSKIDKEIDRAIEGRLELKRKENKMVFEVVPLEGANKGIAVKWLLKNFFEDNQIDGVPIYIGDDKTDEDAFGIMQNNGIGIFVGEGNYDGIAKYRVNSPSKVISAINWIADSLDMRR